MDRGAWQTTVHGVTESQTRPSTPEEVEVQRCLVTCPEVRGQGSELGVSCVGGRAWLAFVLGPGRKARCPLALSRIASDQVGLELGNVG